MRVNYLTHQRAKRLRLLFHKSFHVRFMKWTITVRQYKRRIQR